MWKEKRKSRAEPSGNLQCLMPGRMRRQRWSSLRGRKNTVRALGHKLLGKRMLQNQRRYIRIDIRASSLVVQMVKNLPATQETWVRSLGQEDPLEKEMATDSSILA